jgi:hypothetical protein
MIDLRWRQLARAHGRYLGLLSSSIRFPNGSLV